MRVLLFFATVSLLVMGASNTRASDPCDGYSQNLNIRFRVEIGGVGHNFEGGLVGENGVVPFVLFEKVIHGPGGVELDCSSLSENCNGDRYGYAEALGDFPLYSVPPKTVGGVAINEVELTFLDGTKHMATKVTKEMVDLWYSANMYDPADYTRIQDAKTAYNCHGFAFETYEQVDDAGNGASVILECYEDASNVNVEVMVNRSHGHSIKVVKHGFVMPGSSSVLLTVPVETQEKNRMSGIYKHSNPVNGVGHPAHSEIFDYFKKIPVTP